MNIQNLNKKNHEKFKQLHSFQILLLVLILYMCDIVFEKRG